MSERTERVVSTLVERDPDFVELCKSLYGTADPEIIYGDAFGVAKYEPRHAAPGPKVEEMAQGAYAAGKKAVSGDMAGKVGRALHLPLEHKAATGALVATGVVANARGKAKGRKEGFQQGYYAKGDNHLSRKIAEGIGLGATVIGGGYAVGHLGRAMTDIPKLAGTGRKIVNFGDKISAATPAAFKTPKAKLATAAAALGGDATATAVQATSAKPKKQQGTLQPMSKSEVPDLELAGTFSKFDDDKMQAFGYASVVKKDGLPVIDRQGDYIDADEMEKAAYHYVQKSRKGGDMHRRTTGPNGEDAPHHVSDLIESMVFTPEKCRAMGLPDEISKKLEGHWWVGYQIHDQDTWEQVRKQGRTGFSIHGRGKRQETSVDEVMGA